MVSVPSLMPTHLDPRGDCRFVVCGLHRSEPMKTPRCTTGAAPSLPWAMTAAMVGVRAAGRVDAPQGAVGP